MKFFSIAILAVLAIILITAFCVAGQVTLQSNQTYEKFSKTDQVRIAARFLYDDKFFSGGIPYARIVYNADTKKELSVEITTDFNPLIRKLVVLEKDNERGDTETISTWDYRWGNPVEARHTDKKGNVCYV